jgi:L-ascorbate metabolism protein UlaG (beta-lactamase superfamily)
MASVTVTYVGGPTALLELGGLRLLTDPTFDQAGERYHFGWGATSRKLQGPAMTPEELGRIDAVLLSHDQHEDNLDAAGRDLLPAVGRVVTTASGARRLGGNSEGLASWESTSLSLPAGGELKVTATPCRHGPPLSRPIVGEVAGFMLEWDGQEAGALWLSGDTVYFRGLAEVARRFDVGTAILNLGGVRFPVTGPARYTLTAAGAVRVTRELDPRTVVPLHFEGWKHFRQGREEVERAFEEAGLSERVRWPEPAAAVTVEV